MDANTDVAHHIAELEVCATALGAVPRGPVEPVVVSIDSDAVVLGRLIHPRAFPMALRPSVSHRTLRRGRVRLCTLVLENEALLDGQSVIERRLSLDVFIPHVSLTVVGRRHDRTCETTPLCTECLPLGDGTSVGVVVYVDIPADFPLGSEVTVTSLVVAGHPIDALDGQRFIVQEGLRAPLELKIGGLENDNTPAVTPTGELFVPGDGIQSFSPDGAPLVKPQCEVSANHLACCDYDNPTILVAGRSGDVYLIDASTRVMKWSLARGRNSCFGVSSLPLHGVAIVSAYDRSAIDVVRVNDGSVIESVSVAGGCYYSASDPRTGIVFVGKGPSPCSVTAFRWNSGLDGSPGKMECLGIVDAADRTANCRPMVVVPPANGLRTSYLVLGTIWSSALHVVSLPSPDEHFRPSFFHTHKLLDMEITGLGADLCGSALIVSDRRFRGVHVLSWPLPGMPPLT